MFSKKVCKTFVNICVKVQRICQEREMKVVHFFFLLRMLTAFCTSKIGFFHMKAKAGLPQETNRRLQQTRICKRSFETVFHYASFLHYALQNHQIGWNFALFHTQLLNFFVIEVVPFFFFLKKGDLLYNRLWFAPAHFRVLKSKQNGTDCLRKTTVLTDHT